MRFSHTGSLIRWRFRRGSPCRVFNEHFKGLHKESYQCSVKCCDAATSQQDLAQCLATCGRKLQAAEQVFQTHFGNFQETLQRALQTCQDDANTGALQKTAEDRIKRDFEACLLATTSKFEKQLPSLQSSITADIKQVK